MSTILKRIGRGFLRPFVKLRASFRRNAIIIANASPEELRRYKEMLDESKRVSDARREVLARSHLPGNIL
jgi:hypothetical protein